METESQHHFHPQPPDPPDRGSSPVMGIPEKSYCSVTQEDESKLLESRAPQDLQALGLIKVDFFQNNRLFPKISIAPKFAEVLNQPWKQSLIVKLLGRNIGFPTLEQRVKTLWKCVADFNLMDLGFGFYMVNFNNRNDRERVIYGGPWLIQGHYLTVRTWSPDFIASDATVTSTMVWIRFPSLPVRYYHEDLLIAIGNTVGKAIKVDKNTLEASRGRFARVCVEIDLTSPLVAQFSIDEVSFRVEYEGLHTACTNCGRYGHLREVCKFPSALAGNIEAVFSGLAMDMTSNNAQIQQQNSVIPGTTTKDIPDVASTPYGPFMMAPRRQYKPREKRVANTEANPPKNSSTPKAPTQDKTTPIFSGVFQGNGGDALSAATVPGGTSIGSPGPTRGDFSCVQTRNRSGKAGKGKGKVAFQPLQDITNHNPFGVLERDVPEQSIKRGKRSRVGISIHSQNTLPSLDKGNTVVGGNETDFPTNEHTLNAKQYVNGFDDDVTMENGAGISAFENADHDL